MPIAHFTSPFDALVHAQTHPWPGNDVIAVVQHSDTDYTLRAFARTEWPASGGYQAFLADHDIVAWHIADVPQAPFEALLNSFENATRTCETCGVEVELDEDDEWIDAGSRGAGRLVFCHDQDETHDEVRHSARV